MELSPDAPLPDWATDQDILVEEIIDQDGFLLVSVKNPGAPRSLETRQRGSLRRASFTAAVTLFEESGLEVLRELPEFGLVLGRAPANVVRGLVDSDLVDYIEPRIWLESHAAPNQAKREGSMSEAGSQNVPWGINMMRFPEAWTVNRGASASVTLGIIDFGYDRGHADLPVLPLGNCAGPWNGCTDSAAGGWHGTIVTGVAVALDNHFGVVGGAPDMLPTRIFQYSACVYPQGCAQSEIVNGLYSMLFQPNPVVNISSGSPSYSPALNQAIQAAVSQGLVIVASVGQDAGPTYSHIQYPAGFSGVLAVSGVRINGTFAGAPDGICGIASLHGPHVDLAAAFSGPTTVGNNSYGVYCGTSLAAAQVSAAAVLVRAANPSWSGSQVRNHLKSTALPASPAAYFGSGILDAGTALGVPLPPPPPPLSIEITGPDLIEPGATCSWWALAHDGTPPFSYFWQGDVVPKWVTTQQYTGSKDPMHPDPTFSLKVTVTDADGRTGQDTYLVTEHGSAPVCVT